MVERRLLSNQGQIERRVVSRDEFGEGNAGDYAYLVVSTSDKCWAKNPQTNEQCQNYPVQTLDYDVLGSMEAAPNCSEECLYLLQGKIREDLTRNNMTTVFGKNGWGRVKA